MLELTTKKTDRRLKVGIAGVKPATLIENGKWVYPIEYPVLAAKGVAPSPTKHFGEGLDLDEEVEFYQLVKFDALLRSKYDGKGVIFCLNYGVDLVARTYDAKRFRLKPESVESRFCQLDENTMFQIMTKAKEQGVKTIELFARFLEDAEDGQDLHTWLESV
ncbi:MAG: hypothetical protein WC052_06100 [Patescibacteria group bacterium]